MMRCTLLALVWAPLVAGAQDSVRAPLPTVHVTATREGSRAPLELPYAVTIARPDSLAALRRGGVDELLFAVPGVTIANRQNPAQDPRVSIRGFGARSAFGVRGIRVLQDGVPVTLPDGQTPVDVIDVENADRVDVVRGSASSLYGNAAGGVIDIRSVPPAEMLSPFARVVGGGSTPTVAATGVSNAIGSGAFTSSVTRISGRGYRDYSDQRATKAAGRLLFNPSADGTAPFVIAARWSDVEGAQSPGALTRAQFDLNPRQADPQAVLKGAGKTVSQGDLSLSGFRSAGSLLELSGSVFGTVRTLDNPTAPAIIHVARGAGGASLRASTSDPVLSHKLRLSAGVDAQWLNDDRQEYANCIGTTCTGFTTDRGAVQKDQRELVGSVGPYLRAELAVAPDVLVSAGMRSDAVQFRVRDRLITATNPDDSGERTLSAVSPSAGVVWRASPLASVYASVSSSFETPTTTELGNKQDGTAGINPDLQAQHTLAYELGTKGLIAPIGVQWDIAAFEDHARDELVPFDIPGGNGRRFYRNAGRTTRRGGEVGIGAELGRLSLRSAYEYSHFRYDVYTVGTASYAGNRIPGVPEQALNTSASLRMDLFTLSATADLARPADVDDANSAQVPGRAVFGAAVRRDVTLGGVRLSPLVALQNIGGVAYAGSVTVNAAGGKFYEPAPGRVLLVRVALSRDAGVR